MNKFALAFIILMFSITSRAQTHDIGIFGGLSNYIGDIGETNYINPEFLTLGAIYKWNRSPFFSYRFSVMTTNLEGNDLDSDEPTRNRRQLQFENRITEVSAGVEYNFREFDLHLYQRDYAPYVYTGISYFNFNELYFEDPTTPSTAITYENGNSFAIPLILGVKANIADHWNVGLEIGARYTFTDNIDGSNNENFEDLSFGNVNSDDWYVFSGFTVSYTFGRRPCYNNCDN